MSTTALDRPVLLLVPTPGAPGLRVPTPRTPAARPRPVRRRSPQPPPAARPSVREPSARERARVRWVPADHPAAAGRGSRPDRPRPDRPRPERLRAAGSRGRAVRGAVRPAPRPGTGRLRLTRRGRLLITCTTASVLAGAVLLLSAVVGGPAASAGTSPGPSPAATTVLPGQTLSEIAGDWAPGQDWRDVAVQIVELNEMPSQAVRAGQRLALPDRR